MLSRQIFLIGMPGSGKSTVGRRAAREASVSFLDLDDWIEETSGMRIPDIFEKHGEAGFRRMETGALAYLTRLRPGLISLGGGTPMNPENRKILRAWGSVILLDRPIEKILEHLQTGDRPLLREDPEKRLQELYAVRMPVYRSLADVTLRNDGELSSAVLMLVRVLKDRYHA